MRGSDLQPIAHAGYVKHLRKRLDRAAFERTPSRVLDAVPHFLLFVVAVYSLGALPPWSFPVVTIVAGHSLACMGFVAHDLSHGAVLAPSRWCRLLEFLFWGMNMVSPTLWRRIHNDTHHAFAATPRDPDRAFLAAERGRATNAYERIFYPGRHAWLRWNPLALVHFVPYLARNIAAAFLPFVRKPAVVPAAPVYTSGQRAWLAAELAGIALLQICLFHLSGARWSAYIWAGPAAVLVASAVIMLYVFTNHFLDPVMAEAEPMLGTTSVRVPRWMDLLHGNFSHHVEHHLFPAMSSRHFPAVRAVLVREFPERYHCPTLLEAWRALAARESWER